MSDSQPKASRRGFVLGAATAGAAAATVVALPQTAQVAASEPALKPPPANGGGYQLTEHVKRYYKTTRL